jgi:hypothetical protein
MSKTSTKTEMKAEPVAENGNGHPVALMPEAAPVRPSDGMLSDSETARAVAEIQTAMLIARRFPRHEASCRDRILQAFMRPELAEVAMYQYARGGSDVSGLSIRAAETMAQYWEHLEFGFREQRSSSEPKSTVEAFAWDKQLNTRPVRIFEVPHTRPARGGGQIVLTDARDVYEHVANQAQRRVRACILAVIPGDVQDAVIKQTQATLESRTQITPEYIKQTLDNWAVIGVTREMLEKRIQRRIDTLTPQLAVYLVKIFNSLRDGMSTVGDWFDVPPPEQAATKNDQLKNKLGLGAATKSDELPGQTTILGAGER